MVCFRDEDVLLVSDGYCARVYASEGRFDADLSGGCDVPLSETPGAVDGAHGSRAQLRADALRTGCIKATGEDSYACRKLALRVARILPFDAKFTVARSAFGPRYRNPVLTGQGLDKLGFHQRAKENILRGIIIATDRDILTFMTRQFGDGELVAADIEDVFRESGICVHANQNAVNAEGAGSRIDIRKQSYNSIFGKLDEDPRSVHRYAISARPLAENNVTRGDDGAADDAALRFQRGVCQISKSYVARQVEVPRLDEHRRRYEDRHAVGSDCARGAVVRLDLPFEFEDQQGRIGRRRYVYRHAGRLGHSSRGG